MAPFILTVLLALLVIVVAATFVSRFKRCPANKILVIYGSTGKGVARCVHGGAAFVWPIFQSYEWLDLEPFVVPIDLDSALSKENIRVSVPTTVTAAISTEEGVMQNAAVRLLGQGTEEVKSQTQEIIFGQMRAVIATMGIEEINRDRQAFMAEVNEAVSGELEKIGLALINVNIRDIEDESGYIKALGQKAAAEATTQAAVDVADQEKRGKIGVAERERDQRKAVAIANSEATVGESEADRNQRKAVAAANSDASVGEAEADRDRRQKLALLDAQAVETESEARARKAAYLADLNVAEEEARGKSESAKARADGAVRVSMQEAEKAAEEARAAREQARLKAEVVVPAEAAKQEAIVNAEAQRQETVLHAAGKAQATKVQMEAEAEGLKAILDSKADGYKSLVAACANEPSLAAALLMIEKIEELARIQAEAIQNLPLDKITVWDSGGNGGVSDLGRRLVGVLPPMHELAKQAGLELPEYLGSAKSGPSPQGKSTAQQRPPEGSSE
jgi:flotillin